MDIRDRAFCFTINNPTVEDAVGLLSINFQYLFIGFERGALKGTEHFQGWIYMKNARSLRSMRKKIPRGYVVIMRGKVVHNLDYCSKDQDYMDFGVCPTQGKVTLDKIEEVMKNPLSNIHLYQQYRKVYEVVKQERRKQNPVKRSIVVECVHELDTSNDCFLFLPNLMSDIKTYKGQNTIVCSTRNYTQLCLDYWIKGKCRQILRGYEVIDVDPDRVIITYECKSELLEFLTADIHAQFIKKYIKNIDHNFSDLDIEFDEREKSWTVKEKVSKKETSRRSRRHG